MKKLFATVAAVVIGGMAHAANYDFIDAIDGAGGPINESIYSTFRTGDYAYFTGPSLSLTGTAGGNAAFAYADAGTAGFGVCRTPTDANLVGNPTPGVANVCNPGSDDSIQSAFDEVLTIAADQNGTLLTSVTVNANHDGLLAVGDKVKIDGVEITIGAGDLQTIGNKTYFTYLLNKVLQKGDTVTIASVGRPHLYLNAVEVSQVPLPASVMLLGAGLAGLGALRRKRKAA